MDGETWTLRGIRSRPRGNQQGGCSESSSEDKPELVGLQERFAAHGNVAGERAGHERMVMSQVSGKSLEWLPSLGSWLLVEENSRKSHSKVEKVYSRRYTFHRVWAISEGKRLQGVELSVYIGMGNFVS